VTGLNYTSVPAHLVEGLRRYFEHGIAPGSFLRAVLENDLAEAVRRGDPESLGRIRAIVSFLDMEAPAPSWGSPEKVRAWIDGSRPELERAKA
jgi:hypothetical protein